MLTERQELQGLRGSNSRFPQQGQVDWALLGKSTVEFTVETLSRISRAGVEALTLYAANAIFHNAKLGSVGERRLLEALGKVGAFSSKNNTLWFGFGIKSIVNTLSETDQGLICIGICSCLTEEFSTEMSARVLKELFLLYNLPNELVPSLQQWNSLVESCSGMLTCSEFGKTLYGIAHFCLNDGQSNICTSAAAESIAKVLKAFFDLSTGSLQRIRVNGGADCAWLAAVAHWLFGLSVSIKDDSGDVLYRPGTNKPKSDAHQDTQVTIIFGNPRAETAAVVQKSYLVPSGRAMLGVTADIDNILTHGRPDWSTCLCDTFGKPMKTLLTTLAPQTGAALGAAACIYDHIMCGKDRTIFESHIYMTWKLPPNSRSFGRGFFLQARNWFPELGVDSMLLSTAERMLEKTPDIAIREFTDSIASIQRHCECFHCEDASKNAPKSREEGVRGIQTEQFCLKVLILVIIRLVQVSSLVNFKRDMTISPTVAGIERMYGEMTGYALRPRLVDMLEPPTLAPGRLLDQIRLLFTGRGRPFGSVFEESSCSSAIAQDGLCIYFRSLCDVSADPEIVCSTYVVPGKIQWKDTLFSNIVDKSTFNDVNISQDLRWPADGQVYIDNYDELCDSSSDDLKAVLLVEETASYTKGIVARWQISSAKGIYLIGPELITKKMIAAYSGISCRSQDCGSLNGLKSAWVKGEGLHSSIKSSTERQGAQQDPVVRVLGQNAASVWGALAGEISHAVCLQGRQCIKCAVMTAIARWSQMGGLHKSLNSPLCIITSI